MENIEVTIRFGAANRITKTFRRGTTLGQAIDDGAVQQSLGFPANVRPLIGRIPQDRNLTLQNGDVVDLETVGTAKA